MTLPGGAAAKIGIRYEMWWTLSELVRMLRGDTEAIRLEVPGIDKAEFVVTTGARRELHQAKAQLPERQVESRHAPRRRTSSSYRRGGGV